MKQKIFQTIVVWVLAMMSLQANAQVKAFEKYADTKNVTYVFISKYMLRMAGKSSTPSVPGLNTANILNKLNAIQIIASEDKAASARLKADTQAHLKQGKYELLMQVDEDDQKVRIYHHEGNKQSAVVMMADEDGEFTVIVFSGTFTLEDVMKMTE